MVAVGFRQSSMGNGELRSSAEVPNGFYEINQRGNLDLTVYYPPAAAWPDFDPSPGFDAREIHVDLSIVVRDENNAVVEWIGDDPQVPGTLGPGGQDWDVNCNYPPKPDVSIIKFTNGQDANDPNAAGVPEITPGQPVVWTYDVENIGEVPIAKIYVTVTDNVAGVKPVFDSVKSGDDDDILEPGEIWTYRAEGTALDLETASLPTLVSDVCRQGDVNAPGRTAYTNLGTVSVLSAEDDTDPSSYCNPSLLTLGDRVWYDQNQNGIQDPDEPSYPDALTVELHENGTCADPVAATTTSDGNGFYQFSDLPAGTYSVQFSGLPAGWSISPANQGGDDALDSDANGAGCIENISADGRRS